MTYLETPISELRTGGLTTDVDSTYKEIVEGRCPAFETVFDSYDYVAIDLSARAVYYSNDLMELAGWFGRTSFCDLIWQKGHADEELMAAAASSCPTLAEFAQTIIPVGYSGYEDGRRCSCEDYPCCGH